jgi:hypothetical protein
MLAVSFFNDSPIIISPLQQVFISLLYSFHVPWGDHVIVGACPFKRLLLLQTLHRLLLLRLSACMRLLATGSTVILCRFDSHGT